MNSAAENLDIAVKKEMEMVENGKSRKQYPVANICAVCGQYCFYYYYGAQCCEGCKQFFRRCVIKMRMYRCQGNNYKCGNGENNYCRGCRLNKCLLAGMMPRYVKVNEITNASEIFFEELEQRRIGLLQAQLQNPNMLEKTKEKTLLNLLIELERCFKKLWNNSKALPAKYLNKYSHVLELLESNENLLASKDQYCPGLICQWDQNEFIAQIEKCGIFASSITDCVIKDWFACVEFAKAIPFFKALDSADKINLLKHIIKPIIALCSAYYSQKIFAQSFTRADGMNEISILQAEKFKHDKILRSICSKAFSEPVERIGQLNLEHDEFLLLLAILVASSAADNLSASGRELLYAESVKNTKTLQNMLQSKHGHFGGAQKFSSLMIFLNIFHTSKNILVNLATYLELFYEKQDPRGVFPKVLLSCACC